MIDDAITKIIVVLFFVFFVWVGWLYKQYLNLSEENEQLRQKKDLSSELIAIHDKLNAETIDELVRDAPPDPNGRKSS